MWFRSNIGLFSALDDVCVCLYVILRSVYDVILCMSECHSRSMYDLIHLSVYASIGVYSENPSRRDALPAVHVKEDQGPSLNLVREVTPSAN